MCTTIWLFTKSHLWQGNDETIKGKNPDINIVAIDYDAGASKINQENRIKLMLTNAE